MTEPYTISLVYSCLCRQEWEISRPPTPEEATMHCAEPCVPESCPVCLAAGHICAGRESIQRYKAVDFVEMLPAPRLIRRRAKA